MSVGRSGRQTPTHMETAVAVPACETSKPGRSKYVYVNTVKKLQAQADSQAQLHQELSQQIGLQLLAQSVLADGICQQKVVYDVIIPLHQQWLQDPSIAAADQGVAGCQQQQRWQMPHPELATLVGLMENCNPIVSALLRVSVSRLVFQKTCTCFAGIPVRQAAPAVRCQLGLRLCLAASRSHCCSTW